MRKVESRIQGGFEGLRPESGRGVQTPELALKMTKEMDDHRTILGPGLVPNFTVYLCTGDRATTVLAKALWPWNSPSIWSDTPGRVRLSLTVDRRSAVHPDADLRAGAVRTLAEMTREAVGSWADGGRIRLTADVVRPSRVGGLRPRASPCRRLAAPTWAWLPADVTDAPGTRVQEFRKSRVVIGRCARRGLPSGRSQHIPPSRSSLLGGRAGLCQGLGQHERYLVERAAGRLGRS